MVKSLNQRIIETEKLSGETRGRKQDKGKHFILDGYTAERFNNYCKENFIVRRKLLQKIISDWLNKQRDSQKG